ncbi:putative reverse transcriptase domain-containing protein [Tanacetum coccineum]
MSAIAEALIVEYASAPTPPLPPPSLLSLLSSPLLQIPSPPLPLPSPPTTSPTYVEAPLGYKVARIRLRAASPPTHHLSEIPSPPLLLPSTSHRDDTLEEDMPLWKRARFTTPASGFEIGYGIEDVWDDMVGDTKERAPTTVKGLSQRVTDLSTTLARDTHEIHVRLEDAQDDRGLQRARVNTLFRDRRYHLHTAVLVESKARWARHAWGHAMDCNWVKMAPKKRTATTTTTTPMIDAQIKALIAQGVADALTEIEANKTSRNGDDSHDSGIGSRRTKRAARECTYSDFLKCQPLNFKGTEGLVGLTRWFERIELDFYISNCAVGNHIKFSTCTLLGSALTWWNSYVKAVGHNAAYRMTWKSLMNMLTDKYCPRGKIKQLEIEIWNLKVKGTDVASYTQRFQELALMCERMFLEESDQVEKSVLWLNVKPKTKRSLRTLQGTIKASSSLSKGVIWHGPILQGLVKRNRTEDLNLCALNATTIMMDSVPPLLDQQPEKPKGAEVKRVLTYFECGAQSHFKSNYLKLKNMNQGYQVGNGNAVARAYAVGTAGTNPDSNIVMGMFLLNNRYALILFDTSVDRSFVSTAFSSLIDIIPTTLDYGYDVELANGKIIAVNTLIRGCTLNFLNHPFNIDLMPVELGSFDVIIGMD